MEIDLYTFASFIMGILAGCLGGIWLAGLISAHKVERLEQKVNALSENKFKIKGERVRLKQLEQRLDAEAASIPMAERELQEKSGEIRELTVALNETTALTSELAEALRARKIKVQQLQVEQSKWIKRNKALLMKSEQVEAKVSGLQKDIAARRSVNEKLETQQLTSNKANSANEPVTTAAQAFVGKTSNSSPARAAGHHAQNGSAKTARDGSVDRLNSRVQEMESELQAWFDRVGRLEANVSGRHTQASGLALLEEVLRGEADKEKAVAADAKPHLLGSRSAS